MLRNLLSIRAMLLVSAAVPLPALAQVAEPPPQAAAANESAMQADIVVTATKRSETVQTVPLTVSVISEEQIRTANLTDTVDLKRITPGLQFTPSISSTLIVFTIRGVGTYATGVGLEQSVGVAVDGVPLGRPIGSVTDLIDVANVEVLKGPQGMLFGKNATAGVVNIVTRRPELGVTEVSGRASYATLDNVQLNGAVNLALGADAAIRASAWRIRRDGVVDQPRRGIDISNKNSWGGRVKLLWEPTDRLALNLSGEWTGHNDNGTGVTIREFVPANFAPSNGGASILAYETSVGNIASPRNRTDTSTAPLDDRDKISTYTAQADYDVGSATITAIASRRITHAFQQFEPSGSGSPFIGNAFLNSDDRIRQSTAELRIASNGGGPLTYTAGLFYYDLKLREKGLVNIIGGVPVPVSNFNDTDIDSRSYAAFGEINYEIVPKLHLIAGVRLSRDELSGKLNRGYAVPPPAVIPPFNGPGATFGPLQHTTSTDYENLSGRFGAQYYLSDRVMAYGTYSHGYKGPGINYGITNSTAQLAVSNGLVRPEIVDAFEIGLKSQFLDRRVTVNLALYDQTYADFQASTRLPAAAAIFAVQNAKQLKSTGVDLEVAVIPVEGLTLSASGQYNDARFTDFADAACYPGQTVALGCVNSVQSMAGKALSNAPKWTALLNGRYGWALSSDLRATLGVNYAYRSAVVYNTVADPYERQDGFGLLNLSAGLRTADDRYGITAFANNVTGTDFVARVSVQQAGAFYVNYPTYESNRVFGVAIDARF